MKESKKFFDKYRLNKGYSSSVNAKQSDVSVIRKKDQHIMPPIKMLEEYEELNPGTFEKLFNMAEKEQKHRHSLDLLTTEKYIRAMHLGSMFALVFVILVTTTSKSVVAGSIISSLVFAISAFA